MEHYPIATRCRLQNILDLLTVSTDELNTLRYWSGLYNRFDTGVHPREPLSHVFLSIREHSQALQSQVDFITKVRFIVSQRYDSFYHKGTILSESYDLFRFTAQLIGFIGHTKYAINYTLSLIPAPNPIQFPFSDEPNGRATQGATFNE